MGFAVGESVGPFQITAYVGRGGMATIYKAHHTTLDRDVALKVIHPTLKDDETFLTRFKREAAIVAKLNHPNIVTLYDFAEFEGIPYLIMQFIEGRTLKEALRDERLSTWQIVNIARPVGDALAYAHAHGVLHRDVKPSNILIDNEGQVYLTDFGLARIGQSSESTMSQDMMLGSPQYASPEQAKSESVDERSDLYSLGVVLYEMFTGQPPFRGETPYGTMLAHINQMPPPPRSLNPAISPAMEQVLLKAIAKDPNQRFANVPELIQALEDAARRMPGEIGAPIPLADYAPAQQPRRPRRLSVIQIAFGIVAIALVFLCVTGASILAFGFFRSPTPPPLMTAIISTSIPQAQTRSAFVTATPSPRASPTTIASSAPARETTVAPVIIAPRGKIVYTLAIGDTPEQHSIWVASADGTSARFVTDGANWPTLSPDGKLIAYHRIREEGIYVSNLDGGNQRRIVSGETCCAQWSPDGKRLAYMQGNLHRGDVKIMVVNTDGSGTMEIAVGYNPAWSPDGNRIAYAGCQPNSTLCGLFVHDLRTRSGTLITRDSGGLPQWSPRGDKIVYQANVAGGMAIFTASPDGSGIKQLTTAKGNNGQPVYSDDGNFIFWRTDQEGKEWAIYVMRADGSNPRLLIPRAVPDGNLWARESLSTSP